MSKGMKAKRPARVRAVARIVIWSVVLLATADLFVAGMIGAVTGVSVFGLPGIHVNFGGYTYEDASEYSVGNAEIDDRITELSVNWLSGDVRIIPTEDDRITITENYQGSDSDMRLRWRVEEGELTIQFRRSSRVGAAETVKKDLTVAIPAAMLAAMDEVEIKAVSGNVTYEGNADELSLDTVDGELLVTGDVGELDVHAVQGSVIFRGGVRDGEFECVDADVTMYLDMAANLNFEQMDGNVCLYLSEEIEGFTAELESLTSEISVHNFEDALVDGKMTRWGNGSLRVRMEGLRNKLMIKKSTEN